MKLAPVKDISLKEKIKNALNEYIRSIDTGINNKLPREEVLSKELKVSRHTMRNVLTELEQEGVVIRKHGKGTFINSESLRVKVPITPYCEFSQMIKDSGYSADLKLLSVEIIPANPQIAKGLKIPPDSPIVSVKKLFFANNSPAIYCIDRFPRSFVKGEIIESELNQITYAYLKEKTGISIVRDRTEVYAAKSDEHPNLETYFDFKESRALLVFESIEFDEENNPALYNHVFYNTDFIRFNQVRTKKCIY